jgi:hypothetical protein
MMHQAQPHYVDNHRPCPADEFRWRDINGIERIGLPVTAAGTPYYPNEVGVGWATFENNAPTLKDVDRRIDLLFRNREQEVWRAASRSVIHFRRSVIRTPEVMERFMHLHDLCNSMWNVINNGVARSLDQSVVSPGCRLHSDGYMGLYTPDVLLWSVIYTATRANSQKLTAASHHMATRAELKKMIKDAICSGNYFKITHNELVNGEWKLPHLAHYEGPLDMGAIVKWLRDTIGMTPFMVHAHFHPFLCRTFEIQSGEPHIPFSINSLCPGEALAPFHTEALPDSHRLRLDPQPRPPEPTSPDQSKPEPWRDLQHCRVDHTATLLARVVRGNPR